MDRLLSLSPADRAKLLIPRETQVEESHLGRSGGTVRDAVSYLVRKETKGIQLMCQTILPCFTRNRAT
jgi:hypothetical protein